jgi:hypothetical protein
MTQARHSQFGTESDIDLTVSTGAERKAYVACRLTGVGVREHAPEQSGGHPVRSATCFTEPNSGLSGVSDGSTLDRFTDIWIEDGFLSTVLGLPRNCSFSMAIGSECHRCNPSRWTRFSCGGDETAPSAQILILLMRRLIEYVDQQRS